LPKAVAETKAIDVPEGEDVKLDEQGELDQTDVLEMLNIIRKKKIELAAAANTTQIIL